MARHFPLARALAGAICAAAFGAASRAAAQTVRGTLVEEGSQRPLGGAVMVLLDASGKPVARTFTRDDGRFFLAAPGPGRYSLRSQRIGYRSTTTPDVALAADQIREFRVEAEMVPVMLRTVRATAEKRCVSSPGENPGLFAVWEEARKALDATELTQAEHLLHVSLLKYERELDPRSLRVRHEQRTSVSGVSENPFVSRPAAELSQNGYVRDSADVRIYSAPDARALLSDVFLRDHCFRVQEGQAGPSLIGLAFEPVRQRQVADIAGVLWLDEATAELRYLEYRYSGIKLPASTVPWGGRIEFQRMPAGTWIVRRWWIRMPVLSMLASAATTTAPIPGQAPEDRVRPMVSAVREVGGEVTSVEGADGPARAGAGVIAGVVFDSTRSAPLAGARVSLVGTDAAAMTDGDGRFRLMGLLEGAYEVAVHHPRLDSLGLTLGAREVAVRYGSDAAVTFAVPPLRGVLAAQCPDSTLGARRVLIRGAVRTAEGEPAPRAVVSAAWKQLDTLAGGRVRPVGKRVDIAADETGAYRVCGVPAEASVRLSAVGSGLASLQVEHRPSTGELAVHDLVLLSRQAVADVYGARGRLDTLPASQVVAEQSGPAGFEARRQHAMGFFLTRQDIERQGASRLTDLMRVVPGLRVDFLGGEYVVRTQRSTSTGEFLRDLPTAPSRNTASAAPGPTGGGSRPGGRSPTPQTIDGSKPLVECRVTFVVDGHVMDQVSGEVDQLVRPDEIVAIEVYRGAAETPPQFQQHRAACGVVVIWTKRRGDS